MTGDQRPCTGATAPEQDRGQRRSRQICDSVGGIRDGFRNSTRGSFGQRSPWHPGHPRPTTRSHGSAGSARPAFISTRTRRAGCRPPIRSTRSDRELRRDAAPPRGGPGQPWRRRTVHRLPNPADPDHLAALELRRGRLADSAIEDAAAILRRRTDRRPFGQFPDTRTAPRPAHQVCERAGVPSCERSTPTQQGRSSARAAAGRRRNPGGGSRLSVRARPVVGAGDQRRRHTEREPARTRPVAPGMGVATFPSGRSKFPSAPPPTRPRSWSSARHRMINSPNFGPGRR